MRRKIQFYQYKKSVIYWLTTSHSWDRTRAGDVVHGCADFVRTQWERNIVPANTARTIDKMQKEILAKQEKVE